MPGERQGGQTTGGARGRGAGVATAMRIRLTAGVVWRDAWRLLLAGASVCTSCIAGTYSNATGAGRAAL